ncbi:hypothetical protein [Reyranella sp.]|uniref:hypothetical protein n=1 Tax=Reyranella sp. TaxID=1929291 RepID=UPI003783DC7E
MSIDLRSLADRLQARADGDAGLLALAHGLRQAVDAERPGAAIAKALSLPANRRSPARIARAQAFARMAACRRYAGLQGKPLYESMLRDLQRYAASAWLVDRRKASNPYLAHDWHAGAWEALTVDATVPGHWKTLKRARGQISVVHGERAR